MLKLNETPIRTSRIFGINNIKLEDNEIETNINEFEGLTITGDISNIEIKEDVSDYNIKYGVGNTLINQIKAKSNKKIGLTIKNKVEEPICLIFDFDEDNNTLVENIEIIAEKNSKATIVIKYMSNSDYSNYHNGLLKLISKEQVRSL